MMLVNRAVLEDVNSLNPPVPIIAFVPHPTCLAQRLHARSKPAFLKSICTIVVKDMMYVRKANWELHRDVYYDNMILVHDASVISLLREHYSDVRQIGDKGIVNEDKDEDLIVIEHETTYEVSKVKWRS